MAAGHAASDVLTVMARHGEGRRRGALHAAAEAFDRATRPPYGGLPARTPRAARLRAIARLLAVAGQLSDDHAYVAMVRLIVDLSLLADALAELRDSQQRFHQARAARTAARLLRATAQAPAGPVPQGNEAGTAPLTGPLTTAPTPRRNARRHAPRTAAGPSR